jgi:hypothetical protein
LHVIIILIVIFVINLFLGGRLGGIALGAGILDEGQANEHE